MDKAAPLDAYFACSKGLTTFIPTAEFLIGRDYCVLVWLMPRLTVHSPEELLPSWDREYRSKREPISTITLAIVLGLGAAGTGTGIASLVTSDDHYAQLMQLSQAVDRDIKELQTGLQNLKDSHVSLSEVVLQNRRGLDLIFLKEGGLCAALKEECCFYKYKTGLVQDSI